MPENSKTTNTVTKPGFFRSLRDYAKAHPKKALGFGLIALIGLAAIGVGIAFTAGAIAIPIAAGVAAGASSGGYAALLGTSISPSVVTGAVTIVVGATVMVATAMQIPKTLIKASSKKTLADHKKKLENTTLKNRTKNRTLKLKWMY